MREKTEKQNSLFIPSAAFWITAGLLCLVYALFELFPFGEKTLSWGDMNQQVVPLMMEWKDILEGKSGFLLNLENAGGMSFWGVFFFFLSSPFTFLAAFVEKADLYFLVNILVLLKLALSAFTASLFFREEQPGLGNRLNLFFSLSYGLCGYGLLYYQNLVWLDVLYLFPILMLGLCRILRGRGAVLFTVALSAVIVVNYYLSYMVLLALILLSALFVKGFLPREKRGKAAGKIGAGAVLALSVTSLVWLPSLLQCLHSVRTSQGVLETIRSGGLLTELSATLPMLLCTAAALLPVFAFAFPASPKRGVILKAFFLMLLPLIFEPVNKLWHTGSYQAFPARYGYIPLFLALWYGADVLEDLSAQKNRLPAGKKGLAVLIGFLSAVVIIGAAILLWRFREASYYTRSLWFDWESFFLLLLFSLPASLAFLSGSLLYKKTEISQKALGRVLLVLCLVQGGFHTSVFMGSAANLPLRERAVLKAEETLSVPGLYRVKTESKLCDVNLLGASGHPTLNHYTSLTDEKFLHAVKKLGYSSYWMETSASCGTGLSDALLSNRYTLTEALEWNDTGAGTLGYVFPADSLPEAMPEGDRFEQQEDLFRRITGLSAANTQQQLFQRWEPNMALGVSLIKRGDRVCLQKTEEEGRFFYQIRVSGRKILYFDAFCENTNRLREPINNAFTILVNGKMLAEQYPTQSCNGILELGTFENEAVKITVLVHKNAEDLRSFGVAGLDFDKLNAFTSGLKNCSLEEKEGKISGMAEAARTGQALFLSVPFAPGMKAAVNGKPAKFRVVLDCFLEIPLEQGLNTVELSYLPQGVKTAVLITCFGLAVLLLFLFFHSHSWGKKVRKAWEKAAGPLLTAAFWIVLFSVYLMPILLWL